MSSISNGKVTNLLQTFIETHLGELDKIQVQLGVADKILGEAIARATGFSCCKNTIIDEILRGIRTHFANFFGTSVSTETDLARLGLGHAFSRSNLKQPDLSLQFNVTQSTCLAKDLKRDLTKMSTKLKSWYSESFPELVSIITDSLTYAKLVIIIQDKCSISDSDFDRIDAVLHDQTKTNEVITAAKFSMGMSYPESDLKLVVQFAQRIVELINYRSQLDDYNASHPEVELFQFQPQPEDRSLSGFHQFQVPELEHYEEYEEEFNEYGQEQQNFVDSSNDSSSDSSNSSEEEEEDDSDAVWDIIKAIHKLPSLPGNILLENVSLLPPKQRTQLLATLQTLLVPTDLEIQT
eukprot:TRINITY_DN1718_c0_g2_i1.p1 TRINITY_DN1718_c0_g2~~TRINITY_DN1718_c0_g2_i1.p1  ORF type:complete len:412 (-),score=60.26 TRINITY_DN1718_c0_g2_i1:312-1364(-)